MLRTPPIAADFNPTVLIYHEKCMDGFAAAQIAYNYDKNIRLIPYSHKDKIASRLNNQNIVFIDCSYERIDLIGLQRIANKFLFWIITKLLKTNVVIYIMYISIKM